MATTASISLHGKNYPLKRYLTREEITGIWFREADRRQYRNENDLESIERCSDELKIEHKDIITKCTYENFNLLPGNIAFDLVEQIVYDSEVVRGVLYQ